MREKTMNALNITRYVLDQQVSAMAKPMGPDKLRRHDMPALRSISDQTYVSYLVPSMGSSVPYFYPIQIPFWCCDRYTDCTFTTLLHFGAVR